MEGETHIGTMRRRYAENCYSIRKVLQWSENAYNDQWLDVGRSFLENHYPEGDVRYASYHRMIVSDRKYWQWWLAEWKRQEAYFLKTFIHPARITIKTYLSVMSRLLDDGLVEESFFNNYIYQLNHIKNGINETEGLILERQPRA